MGHLVANGDVLGHLAAHIADLHHEFRRFADLKFRWGDLLEHEGWFLGTFECAFARLARALEGTQSAAAAEATRGRLPDRLDRNCWTCLRVIAARRHRDIHLVAAQMLLVPYGLTQVGVEGRLNPAAELLGGSFPSACKG